MIDENKTPPAVAEFAVAERAELLARIEEQAWEIDRLKRERSSWQGLAQHAAIEADAALKAQPSGVALPEPFGMRPFQTVDQGSTNYKAGFNAALRKVRERLNSPPVSAGESFCEYCGGNDEEPQDHCMDCTRPVSAGDSALREAVTPQVMDWIRCGLSVNGRLVDGGHPALQKLRAALTAQPDHSEDILHMVPDEKPYPSMSLYPDGKEYAAACGEVMGWNACRRAMLATTPEPGKEIE